MIIIDDYLNDSILIEIKKDNTFKEGLPYQYWEGGYWNNEPDSNVKMLISKLFTNKLIDEVCNSITGEGKFYPENYNGVEYWINVLTTDTNKKSISTEEDLGLDYHTDKDEELLKKEGRFEGPKFGCVFYYDSLIDEVEGGYLKIFENLGTNKSGRFKVDKMQDKQPMVITPKFNRMIFFSPGDDLHCVSPVISGTRSTLAINFWNHKPLDYE